MVTKDQVSSAAKRAVFNIAKHGDTDIFPFPFENHAFFDNQAIVTKLICEYDQNFEDYLVRFGPSNISSLTPVTYSGFRWATQMDPIWNAYFLTCVLVLADAMEAARIPKEDNCIFSYRYQPNDETGDLFHRDIGWYQFMKQSTVLSEEFEFVVICDIAEFYPRIGHHRLENALKQVAGETPYPKKIMKFLSNFSNTNSFGLPIGGPAARILSEITINQIDRLLLSNGIKFTRFADDYHLFARTREDAYRNLIFLSEKLYVNQGLSLQKAKTRIVSSAEFRATNPIKIQLEQDAIEEQGGVAVADHKRNQLLRFSLRFDPYSPTSEEDYQRLQDEVKKFDILGLLKEELAKSQIHVSLARKIVSSIRYLDGPTKDDAVLSVLENCEVLYPIFSSVLLMIDKVFEELSDAAKLTVISEIQKLIKNDSHVFRVDIHLSYAIRVLAHSKTPENIELLQRLYEQRTSPLIRQPIILIIANWGEWYWLSDLKNRFRQLSGPERRSYIVASYGLADEGKHWRDHISREFDPFEKFVKNWAGDKVNTKGWSIPL